MYLEAIILLTIGSGVLLFLLFWGLIKHRSDYLTYIIKIMIAFSVYINVGYFFKLGSFELAYSELMIFLVVLVGLFKVNIKLTMSKALLLVGFLTTIFIGYFHLSVTDSPPMILPTGIGWDAYFYGRVVFKAAELNSAHIMRLIRITLFIVLYYVFDKYILINEKSANEIKVFIVKFAVVAAIFGIFEQFFKLFISPSLIGDTLGGIFGYANSQLHWYVERGGIPVLQGLTLEPGHYVQSFIPAILILFTNSYFTSKQTLSMFMLFSFVIFLSGSFAGFAILLFMIALYVLGEKRNFWVKVLVFLSAIILVSILLMNFRPDIFIYYTNRLQAFFTNQNIGSSESVRLLSVDYATDLIKRYPFFGVGFGTTGVSGFIPSILLNFGLIGTVFWLLIMLNGFVKTTVKNRFWLILLIPIFFFIGGVRNIYGVEMILIFAFVFRKTYDISWETETNEVSEVNNTQLNHTAK